MSDTSPRLELPYIQAAQAQKHVTHNEALRVLDVLVQLSVEAFDATTPPPLPQEGAVYALGAGASGAWSGHDGDLALSVDGYWDFYTPAPGWVATLAGSDTLRIWTGSAWEAPSIDTLDNLAKLGINTTADTTNRLAVSSPATLFSHAGDDHQMKINKASAGDTASLLFQSNWSGRAEMGLAGSDAFSVKVSADGSSWKEALVIDPATGRLSTGDADLGNIALAEIAASLATTAADVFIYDTSKDSDGGAWRDRCQHTSWYNEPLNTATRGARREPPAVAVVVAGADKVTIHDGDDASLPLWRVWDFTGYTITSVAALDGKIVVGTAAAGAIVLDLIANKIAVVPTYSTTTSPAIVNNAVNDVAIAALSGAPVSLATGLPVSTIAVGTNGDGAHAATLIKDTGVPYNLGAVGAYSGSKVTFRDDGALVLVRSDGKVYMWTNPGTIAADGVSPNETYIATSVPALFGTVSKTARGACFGSTSGLSLLMSNPASPAAGMVAKVTSTYATGWMPGSIKGAWLASTVPTNLVGGTDADRSVNAKPLTVNGTMTRTPVETGAELVAYSGFSSTSFLERAYDPDLDFGTGDFCVMGWVKEDSSSVEYFFDRGDGSTNVGRLAIAHNNGRVTLTIGTTGIMSGYTLVGSTWTNLCLSRTAGIVSLHVNGRSVHTSSKPLTVSVGGAARFGISQAGTSPLKSGSMALWRISGTAPTAEQIAKIHADELPLFQENAACTLYGASDAVTALARDPVTDLLHVGTSAGRSDLQGLRRVDNTTTAITTAIAASGGLIVEQ